MSHPGSRSISTTALHGKISFMPHVMMNFSSLEKTSRPYGVVIWWRTLRCLTGQEFPAPVVRQAGAFRAYGSWGRGECIQNHRKQC